MVASKSNFFDEELQQKANLFKVLAHPARLQILQHLALTGNCLSGDISDMFPLKRTTVNQHMKELKNAGLIVGHEKMKKIIYCLNYSRINELEHVLENLAKDFKLPKSFCCEYQQSNFLITK
jgi:ArsR family transcriptional regulator